MVFGPSFIPNLEISHERWIRLWQWQLSPSCWPYICVNKRNMLKVRYLGLWQLKFAKVHLGISRNSTTPVAFHLRICLTLYLIYCIIKSPISLSLSDHTRLYFTKKRKTRLFSSVRHFISCDVKENTPRQNFSLGGRLGLQCTSHHLVHMY